jgi:hypothetical protein
VTTGLRGLEGTGAALRRMLGDKPASPVLGCCSWSRGKVNVGKATFTVALSVQFNAGRLH